MTATKALRVSVTICLGALLAACGSGFSRGSTPATGSDIDAGLTVFNQAGTQRLPSVSGTTLTGQTLSARVYAHGAPLVVNVWASWCGPCRQELPLLARVSRHGVRVLGIDERDTTARARALADSAGVDYPSLTDPRGGILARLRQLPQMGIPSTLVVAADGRIAARVVGPLTVRSLSRALTETHE